MIAQLVKESACHAGDLGSIPGSERFSGEGNGNPLQYSGLDEIPRVQSTGSVVMAHGLSCFSVHGSFWIRD